MLQDRSVHCIGGKVKLTRPGYSSVFKPDLRKQGWVAESGKNSSLRRLHHTRHINRSSQTIRKHNFQSKPREGFDPRHAPGRLGRDLVN